MPDPSQAAPPNLSRKDLMDLLISRLEDFAVVLLSPDGRFTSWHPGIQRIFDYAPEDFIGQHLEILFVPADRQMGVVAREIQTAVDVGVANDTRWLNKRDGTLIMVDGVTIALRLPDGRLAGFGKVLRDVTGEKKTRDELKVAVDALNESNIIVRDWDGLIEQWTAGCERLYGWSAAEAIGQVCWKLLETALPIPRAELAHQLLTRGSWHGEIEQRHRNGRRLSIAAQWVLIRGGLQDSLRVIETQTDVSDRAAMRVELERTNRELRRISNELASSNQELSEFAAIASHDLRAPLTSAGWLVELLATRHLEQLDPTGRNYVQQVQKSLARMSDLMDGILAHARAGMGSVLSSTPSDADAAFTTALENLRHDIETSGAFIARDAMPPVLVDSLPLTQLFQNLLANAIKYRKPDIYPSIRISVTRRDSTYLFAIRDNGIGIEPGWHTRIFLPMQRSHDGNVSGSGIGLATCRKIVTRAGGEIWVESVPDEGSTFYFTLPKPASEDSASLS